jgi:hypothetical protein
MLGFSIVTQIENEMASATMSQEHPVYISRGRHAPWHFWILQALNIKPGVSLQLEYTCAIKSSM